MKKIIFSFIFSLLSPLTLAQGYPEDWMLEMEKRMDELMREALQDMQVMDSSSFLGNSLARVGAGVSLEWEEGASGRMLTVTPADKESKMDVQVLNGVITIKLEIKKSGMASQSSRTQLVPGDCDGSQVKMESKAGALVLTFPWKKGVKDSYSSKPLERKPLKTGKDAVDI